MVENGISAPYPTAPLATDEVLGHKIKLAACSDSAVLPGPKKDKAPNPKCGGSRTAFYYMFKAMILKYFSIKGRASRKEYWSFVLLIIGLEIGCLYLFFVREENFELLLQGLNYISYFTAIPTFTLIIRRVHDFGKSGWWLLVPTYKIILFAFIKGDSETNAFGAPE